MLYVQKISESAKIPSRSTPNAAGYDLYSAYNYTIVARSRLLCKTDLVIAVPEGTYGRIAPRSGLASKHALDIGAGVIDSDYRGSYYFIFFFL